MSRIPSEAWADYEPPAVPDDVQDTVNAVIGAAIRLWAWSIEQITDGYLPEAIVEEIAEPVTLGWLREHGADGRPPFLHRITGAGERCDCLEDRAQPADTDYALHDFPPGLRLGDRLGALVELVGAIEGRLV